MAEKTDVWMPLWIGSYLADTMKLTTIQHGAYLLLLMSYWRERAPLMDNDEELRSITKTDKSEWKRLRPVLEKFFKVAGGVWWHKRVEHEMVAADERAKKASEKAEKAAQARWGAKPKDATGNATSIPQEKPKDVLNECPPPSPNKEEEAKASLAEPLTLVPPIPPCPIDDLIDRYCAHLPMLPGIRKSLFKAGKNADAMRSRWRWVMTSIHEKGERKGRRLALTTADGIDWFDRYFGFVAESDFLTGKSGKWTACDLAWLLTASKFEAVLGGKYHAKEEVAA